MTQETRITTRWAWLLLVLVLGVAHVWLVNYYVPSSAVFGDRPLSGTDYDLHVGQVKRVVEGLHGWGKSWVYDVKLVAGHPEGTITDSGSKGWELWAFALTSLGVPFSIAFNTWVWLVMLAAPLLVYAAGRTFELDPFTSLLAAAFTSLAWFFDSNLHWLWFVGMISWAGACCLSLLTLGLFHQLIQTRRLRYAAASALTLGAGLLVHPYTFFALAPPMAASYLRGVRSHPRRVHGAILGIVVCALAMNAFWLMVSVSHWHYILNSAFYAQGGLRYLWSDFFELVRNGDTGLIGVRSGFRFLYLGLALAWLICAKRASDARVMPWSVAILSLLALAYLGAYLPGGPQIQPYRNLTAATLFTTLPAAAFVRTLVEMRAFAGLRLELKLMAAAAGLGLVQHLAVEVLYFFPKSLPTPDPFADGAKFPLSVYGFPAFVPPSHMHYGLPHDEAVEIGLNGTIQWLQAHAAPGSRLLAEGAPFGERVAWSTDFEVMGGFLERNVAHAQANYFRRFAEHPADERQLAEYLTTFGISWIVVILEHPELERSHLVEFAHKNGIYRVYRVRAPGARVVRGGGTLHAQTNRIDVRDSRPNEPLVLSYHFHEALRCQPDCRVEREPHAFDDVGFIRIPAPHPKDLQIFNGYRW